MKINEKLNILKTLIINIKSNFQLVLLAKAFNRQIRHFLSLAIALSMKIYPLFIIILDILFLAHLNPLHQLLQTRRSVRLLS